MTLTWAADIEAKPYPRWQYMACPACAAETCPYGGFGSSPTWKNVGNYSCHKAPACCTWWYANPVTGIFRIVHEMHRDRR